MTPLDDDQLRDARARLVARRHELRQRIDRVQQDLRRQREPLPRDSTEAAIVVENDEVLQAIEATAGMELVHIAHALERMDAGTFGRCTECAGPVDAARLAAVPYAARCGDCEPRG